MTFLSCLDDNLSHVLAQVDTYMGRCNLSASLKQLYETTFFVDSMAKLRKQNKQKLPRERKINISLCGPPSRSITCIHHYNVSVQIHKYCPHDMTEINNSKYFSRPYRPDTKKISTNNCECY